LNRFLVILSLNIFSYKLSSLSSFFVIYRSLNIPVQVNDECFLLEQECSSYEIPDSINLTNYLAKIFKVESEFSLKATQSYFSANSLCY